MQVLMDQCHAAVALPDKTELLQGKLLTSGSGRGLFQGQFGFQGDDPEYRNEPSKKSGPILNPGKVF